MSRERRSRGSTLTEGRATLDGSGGDTLSNRRAQGMKLPAPPATRRVSGGLRGLKAPLFVLLWQHGNFSHPPHHHGEGAIFLGVPLNFFWKLPFSHFSALYLFTNARFTALSGLSGAVATLTISAKSCHYFQQKVAISLALLPNMSYHNGRR